MGVATAAMVYDTLPIIDVFRRVTADRVLGLMDLRGLTEPFFFLLDRDGLRRLTSSGRNCGRRSLRGGRSRRAHRPTAG